MRLPRLFRWLLPWAVGHTALERAVMRVLFAATVVFSTSWGLRFEGQPDPNGFARWIDFTFIADWAVLRPLQVATVVGLLLYVFRIAPWLTLLPALVVSWSVGTLVNSQGAINHDGQVLTMVLLGQWVTSVVGAVRGGGWLRPSAGWEDVGIHVTKSVVAASYMVSGVVKLDDTDGGWVRDVPLLAIQLKKTNYSNYYSDLEALDGFGDEAVPRWILGHPNQARLLFGAGLALELFCFLGLAGRRGALAVGLGMVVLHASVLWMMQLDFTGNMALLVIYFVNLPGVGRAFRGEREGPI